MSTATNRTYATGKRKTAIARVWISAGSGQVTVNTKPADQYFERETSIMIMKQALELIEALDQFDVWATVRGGGHSAQAEAMRHGISRALIELEAQGRVRSIGRARAQRWLAPSIAGFTTILLLPGSPSA